MDAKPVVMAVDDSSGCLDRIRAELERRYGEDYRIICEGSATAAAKALDELHQANEEVAVVLADQWMPELEGTKLLAQARRLHPLARRALLIDWGAWGDEETADAIFAGMPRGDMDYYVIKPERRPDELFHRSLVEFLHEWSRARSMAASEITVVGEEWSPRTHELRSLLARNGVPYVFEPSDSEAGQELLEHARKDAESLPLAIMRDGRVLTDPTRAEMATAFGVRTELDDEDRDFDVA